MADSNNITNVPSSILVVAPSLAPTSSYSIPPFNYYYDDYYYNDDDDDNMYTQGIFYDVSLRFCLFVAFVVLFTTRIWQIYKQRQNENDNNNNITNGGGSSSNEDGTTDGNMNLSLEERVELYNTTFTSNGNQLTLKDKHIVPKTKMDNNIPKDDVEEEEKSDAFIDIELGDDKNHEISAVRPDDDGDRSIYLSIESDRNLDMGDLSTSRKMEIDTSMRSLRLDRKGSKEDQATNISGTCIICFEEFTKDDVIVWSENENCNHVYHKDCMVNYLASNADRHKTNRTTPILDLSDNPCPTCRQNYCRVRDADIAQMMLKKITAAKTTTTASSSSNNAETANNNSTNNNESSTDNGGNSINNNNNNETTV